MAAPLQRTVIRGFKSIRECSLELRQLTLLIGGNGSGKSNFGQVFGLLHEVVNQRLQPFALREGGPESLLHFGQKTTEHIEVELEFTTAEDINEQPATAPSRRIINAFPPDQKVVHGPMAVELSGLDVLRQACPHFGNWLTRLETL